ncbi:MAG TPA: hypothetical protein VKP00_18130, partial [Gemmatimonadaceae bacterium]|nr:hypothetical protein [Gemmatimonadaceae bacterium]
PAPRDWPMPLDIVMKEVDVSTNMLATPYCPRDVVANEFYVPGTDPVQECTVHNGALYPDTSRAYQAPTVTVPGAATPIRPSRVPPAADTSRQFRDSAIFSLPSRDSLAKLKARNDSLRRADSSRARPPRPRPDTGSAPFKDFY